MLLRRVSRQVFHQQRTRAYEAHLAADHVDELRQLVKARSPQEPADTGKAVNITPQAACGVAVVSHGSELQHREWPLVPTGSALSEKYGAP